MDKMPPQGRATANTTLSVDIGCSKYLAGSRPVAAVSGLDIPSRQETLQDLPVPVLVIRVDGLHSIKSSWLTDTIGALMRADDVLCRDFLSSVLFLVRSRTPLPALDDDGRHFLTSEGYTPLFGDSDTELPSGPYFLSGRSLHRVFKLYPDTYGAFMYGVIQSEEHPPRSVEICSQTNLHDN